jgi:hypothetical protein
MQPASHSAPQAFVFLVKFAAQNGGFSVGMPVV